MRIFRASYLLVGCIGGVFGWVAHSILQQYESPPSVSRDAKTVATTKLPASAGANTARPLSTQSGAGPAESHDPAASPDSQGNISEMPQGERVVLVPHQSNEIVAMPSTKDTASATDAPPDPMADLLNSMTIWCRFDPGNGAHLRDEKITMYDLTYQGGPITYESIDMDAGTARMTGSAGATGSQAGVLDVLATSTRAGLHFSAVNSRGELVVTTVFGTVDNRGRHAAVMTTHGMHAFDGSFQTYGACETGASKPKG